jgi:hypothetical protein
VIAGVEMGVGLGEEEMIQDAVIAHMISGFVGRWMRGERQGVENGWICIAECVF